MKEYENSTYRVILHFMPLRVKQSDYTLQIIKFGAECQITVFWGKSYQKCVIFSERWKFLVIHIFSHRSDRLSRVGNMDPETFITLIVIVLVLFLIFNNLRGLLMSEMGKPLPGPKPLPLVGNSFDVDLRNIHQSFAKMAKWYGAMFKVKLFRQDVILVNDSQLLKEMLASSAHGEFFNDRPFNAYSKYITYDNKSLVFGPASQKTFTMREIFMNGLNLSGDGNDRFEGIMDDIMKQFLHEINDTNKNDFDINPVIRKSFGNATSALLSGELSADQDWKLVYDFIDNVNLLGSYGNYGNSFVYEFMPFIRFVPGKFRDLLLASKKARDGLLERYYNSAKDEFDGEPVGTSGFTGALLRLRQEDNNKRGSDFVSEENVKSMVLDAVYTATETSATALLNSFALFIEHTDVVKKIQAEMDKVIGTGRLPRVSDKCRMPYLMATVWEVLRYASHIPLALPHRVTKNYSFKGYFIPRHAIVFPNIWYIHHDPTVWTDPWEFRPERFLDSTGDLLPPDHRLMQNVLPFSVGQRKCLGEAMGISKLFLYIGSMLQSFDLLPASSGELPDNDPRNYKSEGAMTVRDFMCRAVPRH